MEHENVIHAHGWRYWCTDCGEYTDKVKECKKETLTKKQK